MFIDWLTLRPWRWMGYILLKQRLHPKRQNSSTMMLFKKNRLFYVPQNEMTFLAEFGYRTHILTRQWIRSFARHSYCFILFLYSKQYDNFRVRENDGAFCFTFVLHNRNKFPPRGGEGAFSILHILRREMYLTDPWWEVTFLLIFFQCFKKCSNFIFLKAASKSVIQFLLGVFYRTWKPIFWVRYDYLIAWTNILFYQHKRVSWKAGACCVWVILNCGSLRFTCFYFLKAGVS